MDNSLGHEDLSLIERSKLPYRNGVGMMLINQQGLILVGRRVDVFHEAWQMPQGGIDEGEAPEVAAMRELEEEVGTNKFKIICESSYWYTYDVPTFLIPKLWNGRYRGQRQKWFLLEFSGEDSDINVETDHPEFGSWRWISRNELLDIAVTFKRYIYQEVLKEFYGDDLNLAQK